MTSDYELEQAVDLYRCPTVNAPHARSASAANHSAARVSRSVGTEEMRPAGVDAGVDGRMSDRYDALRQLQQQSHVTTGDYDSEPTAAGSRDHDDDDVTYAMTNATYMADMPHRT